MNISDFNPPVSHPFGTFGKVEIESFMWWFLSKCFEAGDLDAVVTTKDNKDYLADKGLLEKVGDRQYRLTKKSKEILYTVYGR